MKADYSNGKIYKIVCDTTKLVYIGSTCKQYLSQRLDKHRSCYKQWLGGKRTGLTTSTSVLENNNYSIVLLELVNCKTKDELLARERFHIEANECVNKNIPLRPVAEYKKVYYQDNKEVMNENSKASYQANKEKYMEKYDCECGGRYCFKSKVRHLKSQKHLNHLK